MEKQKITVEELLEQGLLQEPEVYWEGRMVDGASQSDLVEDRLPEHVSGVYVISQDDDVIHVGVSKNIRKRLTNHCSFSGNNLSEQLRRDYGSELAVGIRDLLTVKVYQIEHTAMADLVEAYLIYRHRPRYNEESDGKGRKFNPVNNKQTSPNFLTSNKDKVIHDYVNKKMDMSYIASRYRTSATKIKSLLEEWDVI